MSSFDVRLYEPGDEVGILELFNRVFAEGNPAYVPRTMDVWKHIYEANPAGHEILVATDETGAIIANYSAIPTHCNVKGQRLRCAQAVDTCVAPEWRGSLRRNSVFVTIAKRYVEVFGNTHPEYTNEYMFGLPNEKAFPVGTRIIGYKPVHCPLMRQVKLADEAWIDDLAARAEGVEVVELGGSDDDLALLEALYLEHLPETPLAAWKDAAHLAWRYRDWPGVDYRCLLARRHGRPAAAMVFRLGWMGQPIVPLVDWIGAGSDPALLAGLIAAVGGLALQAGGRHLETWATPGMPHRASLLELGFGEEPSPFNLCIMDFSEHFEFEWAKAHWILTMGDSDIY
ncbi:MAG: hypothetical protein DHS20C15_22950 [Planctomycetota bacterium]|nr:MAG: hypothetical protein DHS20C15_22950 [Planctomycetota bacterium]